MLMATLKVVSASADNLDRNVRALCSDASRESLPANYYQNINHAITQARKAGKIVEAKHVLSLIHFCPRRRHYPIVTTMYLAT